MDKKVKVLYLSYDGMTDPLGQSQVLPYLGGLALEGYEFHLVSFEKPERFGKHRETITSICAESGIQWHPLTYTKNPPVLSTWWDVRKLSRLARKLHSQEHFSIVHCRSYITALTGLSLKRKEGIPFIFDMRGFWADERVDGKLWNLGNPLFRSVYNFFKNKEIQFIEESDTTVSLTERGKSEILSWKGKFKNTPDIHVIPCCADLEVFNYAGLEQAQEPFVLGYLGAIGTWYMLDEMLDFFKVILKRYPDAVFHFLTKEAPGEILEKATQKGISPVSLKIEEAARKMIPELTRNWNCAVFFIRPTYSKQASSPTKLGELMGMGIPVICNTGVGDVDLVVQETQCGVSIDTFSEASYETALNLFLQKDYEKQEIRQGAKTNFDLQEGIKKYGNIYLRLLNKN